MTGGAGTSKPAAGSSAPAPRAADTASSTSSQRTSHPLAGGSGQSGVTGASAGDRAAALDTDAGVAPPMNESSAPADTQATCPLNAYVSNSGSDTVSVIDTTTHNVVATVATGKAPVNPTFTPDRRKVYVSNSQAGTLSVIDVATNQANTIPAGGDRPSGLAFSPDGMTLYVSFLSEDYVSPGALVSIDLSTGKASPPIPMGADPERIALTPSGDRLYVNNLLDGTMAIIDTATSKVTAMITLGDLPFNPLMAPDGSVVYVGVMSANHIAVIDTKTNQITRTIPADSPNGMTFSTDFQSLFVSNALSGTVQEVSLTMDKVLKTQMVGGLPGNIALLPDGKHAYMVRPDGSTVEVLDVSSLMIVNTITVGTGPSVVTIARCAGPTAVRQTARSHGR
jgi:YVTN family beta-propeller protein